jgi:hypothetical protein
MAVATVSSVDCVLQKSSSYDGRNYIDIEPEWLFKRRINLKFIGYIIITTGSRSALYLPEISSLSLLATQ